MEFFECAAKRESCRSYQPDRPVEPEKLQNMLACACSAPSACNSQPWHFYVVQGQETGKVVPCLQSNGLNGFADQAPGVCCDDRRARRSFSKTGERGRSSSLRPNGPGDRRRPLGPCRYCPGAFDLYYGLVSGGAIEGRACHSLPQQNSAGGGGRVCRCRTPEAQKAKAYGTVGYLLQSVTLYMRMPPVRLKERRHFKK